MVISTLMPQRLRDRERERERQKEREIERGHWGERVERGEGEVNFEREEKEGRGKR